MHVRYPGLLGQFRLGRDAWDAPDGFRAFTGDGWMLWAGPNLPVTTLTSGSREVGWLLGWGVTEGGALTADGGTLDTPSPDSAEFDTAIARLGGRWAAIALGRRPRFLPDASASLGAVYSVERGVVASTTTLHLDDIHARPARPTVVPNDFYSFGATSDPALERVLAHHALNLTTFEQTRTWPNSFIERVPDDATREPVQTIVDTLTRVFAAMATRAPLILPITAGRDSRMLVAASRPVADSVEYVTFTYTDRRNSDVTFARAVAAEWGLNHRVLRLDQPTPDDRAAYLHSVGYDAADGKSRDFLRTASRLPENRVWMTGFAGEVGRGRFWREPGEQLSPERVVTRLRQEPTPERLRRATAWWEALPSYDTEFVLDLLYVEQRMSGWIGPQLYGTARFAANVIPLSDRGIVEAMLSLPVEFRRRKALTDAIAHVSWPELEGLPFGRAPGVRGRVDQLRAFPFRVRDSLYYRLQRARLERGQRRDSASSSGGDAGVENGTG